MSTGGAGGMDDAVYRKKLSELFQSIVKRFDAVDPDVAEAEYVQGSVTILGRGKKIIISPQPPVQQVWLAAASLGVARHFSWDESTHTWRDDKDPSLEFLTYTAEVLEKTLGLKISLG